MVRVFMFQQRLASKHYRMRDLKLAARRSASGDRQEEKKNIDLKTALFNKAGLERNRFYFCRCVVANARAIYRFHDTARLNCCQNKRVAFPNSAGFLPASLASVLSLSFSKTGAVEVFATLTAILYYN